GPPRRARSDPGPALHRPDHRRAGADALPVEALPVFGRPPAPGDPDRNGPGRLGDHRSAPGRTRMGADPGIPGDVGPVLLDRVDRAALLRLRLGIAAARGRVPRRLPRLPRGRAEPAYDPSAPTVRRPRRIRRRGEPDPR